ncbi:putative nuclease HARBI1-like [Daphnia sinensis]|uniref:Nuclease HARBI1-like n=1 Tax=Daphnia sinensis TaxID=1820382 RepID=A0AAD5PUK2_9CRUS|nr:putative nuclease HARBI1-like [Daphnia sinensis]
MDDFSADLGELTDLRDYESSEGEEIELRKEERRRRTSRLVLFYNKLIKNFRFDRNSIEFITHLVAPLLPKRKTRAKRNVVPVDMVLIALQFYASGTFQTVVGNVLRYSQSSVSRSIASVSLTLSLQSNKFIKFPTQLLYFTSIASMPGVIGCIDGTHIRIKRPTLYKKAYVYKKIYHFLNVQAICDANYRFLSVCATKPGSCHDSSIFKTSVIGKKLAAGDFGNSVILGDSGYSNTTFLFTPYGEPRNRTEKRFNNAHKTTRCAIERAFGILKKGFKVHSEVRLSPTKTSRVTIACCVLHNIAIDRNRPFDEPIDWSSDEAYMHDPFDETIGNQSDTLARRRGNDVTELQCKHLVGVKCNVLCIEF